MTEALSQKEESTGQKAEPRWRKREDSRQEGIGKRTEAV